MVSPELGVGSLERRISGSLRLLDTAAVNITTVSDPNGSGKVSGGCCGGRPTRSGEPSSTGCAETSSWTLFAGKVSIDENAAFG